MANYEFTDDQNKVIDDLSAKMRFVGGFICVIGILYVVLGSMGLLQSYTGPTPHRNDPWMNLFLAVNGLATILIGSWTVGGGIAFKRVVDTRGNDIGNLMDALGELHKLYTLQYLICAALVVVMIGLVALGIIMWGRYSI
jgi:hypothetical protein